MATNRSPKHRSAWIKDGGGELFTTRNRTYIMDAGTLILRMASLLKRSRQQRGISQLQLADQAGVNPSVVNRAERGRDAKLSTWEKLFEGLGHRLVIDVPELCEEAQDLLVEEAYVILKNSSYGDLSDGVADAFSTGAQPRGGQL